MSMRPPISTLFPYTTLFRSGVGALLAVGSAPQVVVDDVDLVSPLREVHGGGPPEVPVASEDQDAHASVLLGCMGVRRSEEHTSELQSRLHLVCRLLLEKKKQ